jgi:hypothetical protein
MRPCNCLLHNYWMMSRILKVRCLLKGSMLEHLTLDTRHWNTRHSTLNPQCSMLNTWCLMLNTAMACNSYIGWLLMFESFCLLFIYKGKLETLSQMPDAKLWSKTMQMSWQQPSIWPWQANLPKHVIIPALLVTPRVSDRQAANATSHLSLTCPLDSWHLNIEH